jgi:hypothetical protein
VTSQELAVGLSLITFVSAAINVYIGLRLAALQSQIRADSAAVEVAMVKQFVEWKDSVLAAINGKYVTATLLAEIRAGLSHDVMRLDRGLERIEHRCEVRLAGGCVLKDAVDDSPANQM